MNYARQEAEVARKMISYWKSCLFLCHAQKVGTESRVVVCRPDRIDQMVTDAETDTTLSLPHGTIHFAPLHPSEARS